MPLTSHRDIPGLIGPILATLLVVPTGVPAAGGTPAEQEIEALQRQVRELQERVDRLEAKMAQGVPVNRAEEVEPVPGGWRHAFNWNLLVRGMTMEEVTEILGEPQNRRSANKYEFWEYGDGLVRMYLRRLRSWDMPGGIDPGINPEK
jgi:hypothetical protein